MSGGDGVDRGDGGDIIALSVSERLYTAGWLTENYELLTD